MKILPGMGYRQVVHLDSPRVQTRPSGGGWVEQERRPTLKRCQGPNIPACIFNRSDAPGFKTAFQGNVRRYLGAGSAEGSRSRQGTLLARCPPTSARWQTNNEGGKGWWNQEVD